MKFNCYVPAMGALATPDNVVRAAQDAESFGFEHVRMGEHLIYPKHPSTPYPGHRSTTGGVLSGWDETKFESLTLFAFLAGQTSRIRFLTSVTVLALHNPFDIAMRSATLDVLSGGRLTLGVGVGWLRDEYDLIGIPFEERGQVTNESLRILRDLFEGSAGPFEGRYLSYPEVIFEPKPRQIPFPLYICSQSAGDGILTRVARFGQAWVTSGQVKPDDILRARPRLEEKLEAHGRTISDVEIVSNLRTKFDPQDSTSQVLSELEEMRNAGVTAVNIPAGEFTEPSYDGYGRRLEWFAERIMPETEKW